MSKDSPTQTGTISDEATYTELRDGLLKVFRNNVRLDSTHGGYANMCNYGAAAAEAAMALLQLEKQKPPGMK